MSKEPWAAAALRWMLEHDPWVYSAVSDTLRCHFCGAANDRDHRPDCIWQRAQQANANADPPSPTWTIKTPTRVVYEESP